ncbi:hypothetical protein [Lacipirellula parvula]|uniref:Carboxypeptidase regulatory-like domain-containing protein n=1 Tax=Lacipirellula parvula TaxID=2650471 RepID=A0A5K7XB55_9BACT|nr:hypothetical protein [Lacipirellula parvula]BBO33605.1 hypothetical protein PLANPX_3217 [Lacipirellula parvula]
MSTAFVTKALVLAAITASLAGCGAGAVGALGGQATVDGAPIETGTISFKPADNPAGRGIGGALANGTFEIPSADKAKPGKYLVTVQAMKSTGKTRNDPQRGPVPIVESLELADSPQEVEITSANAQELQLAFTTKKK